jgi:predicted dehydrogenase
LEILDMHRIKVVGAGQLGSRHLQALQAVKGPLEIHVVDPSPASLKVAQERFEAIRQGGPHEIHFSQQFEKTGPTDVVIVATNADVRRKAVEDVLASSDVKYAVLEKLLFVDREDYAAVGRTLADARVQTWVNCPMRVMPVYEKIRAELGGQPISYRVTGSQFGMVTNAIHYIDHVVHLTDCESYVLDVSGLDKSPVPSKRAGFLELNGAMIARFADGSRCEITCYPTGNAPVVVEILNDAHRYIVRESEGKLWHSAASSNWTWTEEPATIPYQSQITTGVVDSLLSTGECGLAPYTTSAHVHLALLDPLRDFIRSVSPGIESYPFT